MINLRRKSVTYFNKLILIMGIFFYIFTLINSYFNTLTFFSLPSVGVFGSLILIIGAILAVTHFFTLMNKKQFLIFLILFGVSIRLVWIFSVNTQPFSDFLHMHAAALLAEKGDFSFIYSEYFSRWPYQLGFTLYEAVIIQLFGENIIVLKLFNILFNILTAVVIYLSAKNVFNETSGKIAAFLYVIYIPHIIMSSVLSNQHLSTFLFFLAFYFLTREDFWQHKFLWLYAGVSLALANLFRPLGSFFLLGFIAFAVIYSLLPATKNQILSIVKKSAGVLGIYFAIQQVFIYSLIAFGMINEKPASSEPYWKFMVGLNEASNGHWTKQDTDYVLQFPIGEERNEAEYQLFIERLQNEKLLDLFINKLKIFWGNEDTSPHWSLMGMEKENVKTMLFQSERLLYAAGAFFVLISLSVLVTTTKTNLKEGLYLLVLGGYVLIHILIEIQTRYRFDIMPAIMVLQGFGVYSLYKLTNNIFKRDGI